MNSNRETAALNLEAHFAKTRAAEFGFTFPEFCAMLAGVLDRSAVESLRLDDLVLARACARGSQAAWDSFLLLYRGKLQTAALAIAREESVARELSDSLYADLFGTRTRPDGTRISKLDSYLGRGSLEGWLKIVLAQQYVNRFRSQQRLIPFDDGIECQCEVTTVTASEPEITLLREVTDAALGELASEQRFLLAAYYLDGRTLAEIGRMLNAHESTIKRRLDKTIDGLRKAIISRLCKAGLRRSTAQEMLHMDVRNLEIQIRDRLAQER